MKTSKANLCICLAAIMVLAASPSRLSSETSPESATAGSGSATRWSLRVDRVQPGEIELAHSFQVATYENLLTELNKTHQFMRVFREGDRKAGDVSNLLVLKTTVVKYAQGSETRRAVTTFSGATKLSVRSQLVTREGKVVLDRTVSGNVRFFGSNLRATHNLARNIAKMIKESPWFGSEQPSATVTGRLTAANSRGGL
ncbi:MAG TPA: hypothetical protein VMI10_17990 [Terriglobales bacterium]|nr:hypothetical protein [Terriglobales bacterium]